MKKVILLSISSLLSFHFAQAQVTLTNFGNGGTGTDWSDSANWTNGVPDTNGERARLYNASTLITVDAAYTINSFFLQAANPVTATLSGGTLTIDHKLDTGYGIRNASGGGATLRLTGNVIIADSTTPSPTATIIENTVSSNNSILFDTNSSLQIKTILRANQGLGGAIRFNGTLASSEADLQINSNNVSFGTGHNSSGFGRDIVLLENSRLAVDACTVLNTNRKFQVNGNAELELNGADTINNANIVVGGTNALLLDVNASQTDMGDLIDIGGTLTIDLDPAVTELAFDDSSSFESNWSGGTIAIAGFQEGVIRFGTDANGLTAAQLAVIDGGIYSLTATGYLTAVPEPATFALLSGLLGLGWVLARRKRS